MPRPSLIGGCGHLCPIRPSPRRPQWSPTYNWASVAFSNNLRLPTECFKMKFSLSNFKKQTKKQTFLFAVCYWTKKGNSIKVRYYSILSSAHFWWRTHPKGVCVGGGEWWWQTGRGHWASRLFIVLQEKAFQSTATSILRYNPLPPPLSLLVICVCFFFCVCLSFAERDRKKEKERKQNSLSGGGSFLTLFTCAYGVRWRDNLYDHRHTCRAWK